MGFIYSLQFMQLVLVQTVNWSTPLVPLMTNDHKTFEKLA